MGLDDFERELAAEQTKASAGGGGSSSSRKRERSRSRERRHRHSSSKHGSSKHHHKHHHHSSSRRHDRDDRDSSHRRQKRSRRDYEDESESEEELLSRKRKNDLKRTSSDEEDDDNDDEDGWVEKESYAVPPNDDDLDDMLASASSKDLKRDDWMQGPSAIDVEYVQRKKREEAKPKNVAASEADFKLKMHKNELNHFLRDAREEEEEEEAEGTAKEAEREEVDYEFGDAGSQWRMTKLKAVYDAAKDSGRAVEDVALERFGDLREFDDAREEEIELDRRKMYGKGYVGKIKPSGELFEERRLSKGVHFARHGSRGSEAQDLPPQGTELKEAPAAKVLDATALNKLRAQMMKAKLKKDPKAATLEEEYNAAMAASANRPDPDVVVLSAMDNRMLTGGRAGEVKSIDNKRGRERGLVEENEDMSIEDMVRQERRTKTQNGGMVFAERIAKDAKFDTDLDYMDDNASKLAKGGAKSEINLRNTAIADFQKMNRILDTCPLCHHEDKDEPPVAPIVSLATRVYMTLPTEPEIARYGATIVPIQHRTNLLECDDDEWEEMRNFMKSLTRMYHALGKGVIFYENAAAPHRKRHATLEAVPLPVAMAEHAPAYFREAILQADEEWSQHKKLIDTLKKSQDGLGKLAFRRTLVKDVPYFHVWFTIDGGVGHVVEDGQRWPKGDLFAREILGGMLDVDPSTIKKQGRWHRHDRRVDGFRKKWRQFDWTRILMEGDAAQ